MVSQGIAATPAASVTITLTTDVLFDAGGDARTVAALRIAAVDRAHDRAARRMLESLGAVEVDALEDCAVAPGSGIHFVLVDDDVHALCGFTSRAVPQLRAQGWRVDIDPAYPWQVVDAAAPLVAAVEAATDRPGWFDLELGVEIDGHVVSLLAPLLDLLETIDDLDELARSRRRSIAIRVGERHWMPLPPERLRMLLAVLRGLYRDGRVGVLWGGAAALAELGVALHGQDRPAVWRGDPHIRDHAYALALGPRAAMPALAGLRADLRPYQREGVAWLQHLRASGTGGVLADDMGLGKTLQTIAHLLAEREAGRLGPATGQPPALVVTLTSVAPNWLRELAKFAPDLKVLPLFGPARRARFAEIPAHDVIVTTYPLLARDRDELAAHRFHIAILDEAHAIKNIDAQVHDAARAIDAEHRVCLTGTPIENHLGELWAQMEFLMPGVLGDAERFRHEYRIPIEQLGDTRRLAALRERVKPFILRRTKDAVARDLPAKTELVRAVELASAQRELYESIRVAAHGDVRAQIKARGLGASTIAILDALLKLRQVCCDPRIASGLPPGAGLAGSAKLDLLLAMIDEMLGQGRRILVFSQFARMLALVSEALLAKGVGHVTLTGQTADRQRPIDAFQNGRADVFLISLKAGGTGLNLTRADTVIHYDPWWNPAAQAQATDRAHRIGQEHPVFVYNLIAAGSVEERMLGLQRHKRRLADGILAAGGAGAGALTEADVDDLLAPLG
jgi:superfamily II DNA or RNA helicase